MKYQVYTPLEKSWYTKPCLFRGIMNNYEIAENQPHDVIMPWSYIPPNEDSRLKSFFCFVNPDNDNNINDCLAKGDDACRYKMDVIYERNGKEKKIIICFLKLISALNNDYQEDFL